MSANKNYTGLSHISVLKQDVIECLKPEKDKFFIDCTFGAGGHTKALLEAGAKVMAIDRDKNNEKFAKELQKQFGNNLLFINDKFSNLEDENGDIPSALAHAILLLCGTYYDDRESITHSNAVKIPHAFEYLLDLYRNYNPQNLKNNNNSNKCCCNE